MPQTSNSKRPTKTACHAVVVIRALLIAAALLWLPNQLGAQTRTGNSFQPLQPTIKVLSTNLAGFGIPFQVDSAGGQFLEVQLYQSRDQGKTWSFHSRQATTAREFPFTAAGDGEYWFSIKTLDRNRRLMPEGDPQPELKIIVDTVKPELGFQIQSDAAGRIVCRWQARDDYLNAASFQIQYRASAGQLLTGQEIDDAWQTVPIELGTVIRNGVWADQVAWWPETSDQRLEVRLRIADNAGNSSVVNREVAVQRAAWRRRSTGSTLGQANPYYQQGAAQSIPESTPATAAELAGSNRGAPQVPRDNSRWQPALKPIVADSSSPIVKSERNIKPEPINNRWQINQGQINPGQGGQQVTKQAVTQQRPMLNASAQIGLAPVEFIAPPEPAGWEDFARLNQRSSNLPASQSTQPDSTEPDSIPWTSEVDSGTQVERSFSGSTLAPAVDVAPAGSPLPPKSTDSIQSNPATMIRSGKQIVGESTTSWPANQWQGPPPSRRQPNTNLAPAAEAVPFTPQVSKSQESQSSQSSQGAIQKFPRDQAMVPINRSSSSQRSASNGSLFSSAGFPKPVAQRDSNNRFDSSRSVIENDLNMNAMPESANTQIISTHRFQLNYDIDAIDPSGVGQIDLWMTRDRGRSWKLWGQDPDSVSPFPVEVNDEGIYGFRIVVRSVDGLAGRGPSSGDSADMWILVDSSAPLVKITSVPYGRGDEAGQLIINYVASDANLALRPIQLQWSTNPDGPWTTIEKSLRNDGRLAWKPARNTPERIFLRVEAIDRASNVGVHELPQAIDISGLIPRGTIFGVVPVGK